MSYTVHVRRTLSWADGGAMVEDWTDGPHEGTAAEARASRVHRLREAKAANVTWQLADGVLTITSQRDLEGPCVEVERIEWRDVP